jgi:hypothetical protein
MQNDDLDELFPTISVRWPDHWQDEGDFTLEEIKKKATPYFGRFTGRKVLENKQMIVIAGNVWEPKEADEEYTFSEPMYIMKRTITHRSDKDGSTKKEKG